MTYEDYQRYFEEAAEKEKRRYDQKSVDELLKLIRRGSYGKYYTIWDSVGERASADEAGSDLIAVLRSGAEYLHRYHCAVALLRLLGMQWDSYFKPEKLSARERYDDVELFIQDIEEKLETTSKMGGG